MSKRKVRRAAVFYPGTTGVFVLLIIILSFSAGAARRELVLTLTGAVILAIWAYCLVMTLLLALLHGRRAKNISIRLEPEKIALEGWTNAVYRYNNDTEKNIFQFPGVLVRCRVLLSTKDGRLVAYDFKPGNKTGLRQNLFQVKKRGAYFSAYDEFAVFDILGFFRFAYRIPYDDGFGNNGLGNSAAICNNELGYSAAIGNSAACGGARLLVSPNAAVDPLSARAKGGEANRQDPLFFERTDYLIDHRPYVPGDDPRRINWKLYGHGGELIVRQGEREPPPSSRLTILIDTQYDSLYSTKYGAIGNKGLGNGARLGNSAPDAVDLLCENALAIVSNAGKGIDIQVGFTGQSNKSVGSLTLAETGFFLAYPAALPAALKAPAVTVLKATAQPGTAEPDATLLAATLPAVPEDCGIIILALPRIYTGDSALDKFLAENENRPIELFFIYAASSDAAGRNTAGEEAAANCANFYGRRSGVRARAFGVR